MVNYDTLRELVDANSLSELVINREEHIRFELNHLELHDLDDYLLTCYQKGIKDKNNSTNSNIKYLLGMTDVIRDGPVETVGGSWPD